LLSDIKRKAKASPYVFSDRSGIKNRTRKNLTGHCWEVIALDKLQRKFKITIVLIDKQMKLV